MLISRKQTAWGGLLPMSPADPRLLPEELGAGEDERRDGTPTHRRRSIAARVVAGIVVLHTAFIQLFTIPWLVGLITDGPPRILLVFSPFFFFSS